ncbi:MAG: hypothetical protein O7G86_17915 [Gammaproteobacteria bacterium]|nr:hypothetical protein [Gammaproteobacteria bacterium]
MKLTAYSRLVKPNPLLWAAAAATWITALVLVLIWTLTDEREARLEHFGSSVAKSLAYLCVEPLMKQDRIHLGVLTNRVAEIPGVVGVGIHTVDDNVLALTGTPAIGTTYTEVVTSGDVIVGYVRLSVDRFAFDLGDTPSRSLRYSLSMLVVLLTPFFVLAAGNLVARFKLARNFIVPEQSEDDQADPIPRYLLAINLYDQLSMTLPERELELAYGLTMAEQVANLYQGHAAYLPGTGILVGFEHNDDQDRAFQVVCAAFVLVHLLDEDAGRGTYRLALHELLLPNHKNLEVGAPEVLDTVLLSALAKYKTVAVSEQFFKRILRNERLISKRLDNPLLEELTTTEACHLLTGLTRAYADLIDLQVERLSAQRDSTASESTL